MMNVRIVKISEAGRDYIYLLDGDKNIRIALADDYHDLIVRRRDRHCVGVLSKREFAR